MTGITARSRWPYLALFLAVVLALLVVALARPGRARGAQTGQPADAVARSAIAEAGCGGCHTIPGVPGALGVVGPDLSDIGLTAGDRVAGLDATQYIQQSIIDPAVFVAPQCPLGACPNNVMPPNMVERLDASQIEAIVAYLAGLQGQGVAAVPELFAPIAIEPPLETSVTPFAEPPVAFDDARVVLGKYLFFDPRLSADANLSCATCHRPDQAWGDGQALSDGYTGTGYFRNTPTIVNTAFLPRLYWDGRMAGNDMPTLVRDHITEAHFMNSDGRLMVERIKQVPGYVQLFEESFGSPPSFGGVLNAVTAYVQSIVTGPTPYDAYLSGDSAALSDEAIAGLALFETSCADCHSGPVLSDGRFHVTGVADNPALFEDPLRHVTFRRFFRQLGTPNYRNLRTDVGLYALTKNVADWGAFRTAPLREVGQTAPYMHNGSLTTLADVVRFYDDELALGLSSSEMDALIAFLESLSSEPPLVSAVTPPDYQLRPLGDNR